MSEGVLLIESDRLLRTKTLDPIENSARLLPFTHCHRLQWCDLRGDSGSWALTALNGGNLPDSRANGLTPQISEKRTPKRKPKVTLRMIGAFEHIMFLRSIMLLRRKRSGKRYRSTFGYRARHRISAFSRAFCLNRLH